MFPALQKETPAGGPAVRSADARKQPQQNTTKKRNAGNYDLKWAREAAGLTQRQAAEKMEVRRETYSRWEPGASPIPERKLKTFLQTVNILPGQIPARAQCNAPSKVVFRRQTCEEIAAIAADRMRARLSGLLGDQQ